MIIVRNEKLIKRNRIIGTITGIGAILILGLGTYISFKYQQLINLSLIALLLGLVLYQVSIYYSNRFVRTPRPDQELDAALKGLDDSYALYHYQSPVPHLLVGPAGVWMLLPFQQAGKIVYSEKGKRWKRIGGNLYLRWINQDRIGRQDKNIAKGKSSLLKELSKIPEFKVPEIRAALVFTDEKAEVEAGQSPFPTLHARQLKKFLRKEAKGGKAIASPTVKTIQDYLGRESNQ